MTPWQKFIACILAVYLAFNVGCVAPTTWTHTRDAGVTQTTTWDGGQATQTQVRHHGGEKVLLYVAAGFLIATVFTVDLFLLPFTYHHPFPCCRGVLHICH